MPDGSKILREPQEQVAYQRGPRRLERLTASCSSGPEKANRAKAAQTFGSSIKGGQTPCTTRRTIATNSRGNPGAPAQPALRRKSSDPDKENPLRDKSRLRPPPNPSQVRRRRYRRTPEHVLGDDEPVRKEDGPCSTGQSGPRKDHVRGLDGEAQDGTMLAFLKDGHGGKPHAQNRTHLQRPTHSA